MPETDMAIHFLGLRLTYESSPKLEPTPDIKEKNWNAQLIGNSLELDITLDIYLNIRLRISGEFQIKEDQDGDWSIESVTASHYFQLTDEPGHDSNAFELKLSWLEASGSKAKFTSNSRGDLEFEIYHVRLISSSDFPFELAPYTTGSHFGLNLSASFRSLKIFKNALQLETYSIHELVDDRLRFFSEKWNSEAHTIPLSSRTTLTELSFTAEKPNQTIPINAFNWPENKDASPAMYYSTDSLTLTLAYKFQSTFIESIRAGSGVLSCFACHDQKKKPLNLRVSTDLELSIQPFASNRKVTTFVINPRDSQGNPQNLQVERLNNQKNNYEKFTGIRPGMRFNLGQQLSLNIFDDANSPTFNVPGINPSIVKELTVPSLIHPTSNEIEYAFAGDAYTETSSTNKVNTWVMKGNGGMIPLVSDQVTSSNSTFQGNYFKVVNSSMNQYKDHVSEVLHESSQRQGQKSKGNDVHFQEVLSVNKKPTFGKYKTDYEYGGIFVYHEWETGIEQDHFLIFSDTSNPSKPTIDITKSFQLDPNSKDGQKIKITQDNPEGLPSNQGKILGCVKLQPGKKLSTLLENGGAASDHLKNLMEILPKSLDDEKWIGLVIFQQKIDSSGFPLLEAMLPGTMYLPYLAISPPCEGKDPGKFSMYARIIYPEQSNTPNNIQNENSSKALATSATQDPEEAHLNLEELDITWSDRRLTKFHSKTRLRIKSFAGVSKTKSTKSNLTSDIDETVIDIIGAIDTESGSIRFLAQSKNPIGILPNDGLGIIKQIWLKKIEIIRVNGKNKVDIDGDFKLQPLKKGTVEWFSTGSDDQVKFKGLGLWFEKIGSWLKFDYPSIKFLPGNGGFNLLNQDFIKINLKGIGIDYNGSGFGWDSMAQVWKGWDSWNDLDDLGIKFVARFHLGLELSKLPSLSSKSFDAIKLDLHLGIPINPDFSLNFKLIRLHVGVFGFNNLDLELMRFLTIRAKRIEFAVKEINTVNYPWLVFEDVELLILEKQIIDELTLAYYTGPNKQKGFIGLSGKDANFSFIKIKWILLGRNIAIPPKLGKSIISIQPSEEDRIREDLIDAYEKNLLIPSNSPGSSIVGEWIFAAGLSVFDDFLIGKFLFHDGAYYGIALDGRILKEWFGWDFAIAVLYIQRARPEEDSFYIEIRLPMFSLGAFTFKGGVVALEIQMNGGFLLDVGFPWLDQVGIRDWSRSQTIYISGYMGKAGMYLTKRTSVRTNASGDTSTYVMFGSGMAIMVGIGGAYSSGPFRVEAYAGIYAVSEGAALLKRSEIVGLRLVGAVGIQVSAIGELNWWIISIKIEITVGAEARLTLTWGYEFRPSNGQITLPSPGDPPPNGIAVQLDFVLYARVSARACIGKGWFKICKGVSASVSLPYRQKLLIGA
jgi:hypothetical protein